MTSTSFQCPRPHIIEIRRKALWHGYNKNGRGKGHGKGQVGGMKGFIFAIKILWLSYFQIPFFFLLAIIY